MSKKEELLLEELLDARESLNNFRFQPLQEDERFESLESIDDHLRRAIKLAYDIKGVKQNDCKD